MNILVHHRGGHHERQNCPGDAAHVYHRSGRFGSRVSLGWAQIASPPPADHPEVTVHGRKFTPRSILARNMGTPEDQTAQFPPHKIIGNLYYVGTRTLSSFLIVTLQGNILINSTYERNVHTIEK